MTTNEINEQESPVEDMQPIDSDDEAPECVTMEEAKSQALLRIESERKTHKKKKRLRKRKTVDADGIEQLSDDILAAISSYPSDDESKTKVKDDETEPERIEEIAAPEIRTVGNIQVQTSFANHLKASEESESAVNFAKRYRGDRQRRVTVRDMISRTRQSASIGFKK